MDQPKQKRQLLHQITEQEMGFKFRQNNGRNFYVCLGHDLEAPYFCLEDKCVRPICGICIRTDHKNHDYEKLRLKQPGIQPFSPKSFYRSNPQPCKQAKYLSACTKSSLQDVSFTDESEEEENSFSTDATESWEVEHHYYTDESLEEDIDSSSSGENCPNLSTSTTAGKPHKRPFVDIGSDESSPEITHFIEPGCSSSGNGSMKGEREPLTMPDKKSPQIRYTEVVDKSSAKETSITKKRPKTTKKGAVTHILGKYWTEKFAKQRALNAARRGDLPSDVKRDTVHQEMEEYKHTADDDGLNEEKGTTDQPAQLCKVLHDFPTKQNKVSSMVPTSDDGLILLNRNGSGKISKMVKYKLDTGIPVASKLSLQPPWGMTEVIRLGRPCLAVSYENLPNISFYPVNNLSEEIYNINTASSSRSALCSITPFLLAQVDHSQNPQKLNLLDCTTTPASVYKSFPLEKNVWDLCYVRREEGSLIVTTGGTTIRRSCQEEEKRMGERNEICAYSLTGWERVWSVKGKLPGMKKYIRVESITSDGCHRVFGLDTNNNCIQIFGADGSYQGRVEGKRDLGKLQAICWCQKSSALVVAHSIQRAVQISVLKFNI